MDLRKKKGKKYDKRRKIETVCQVKARYLTTSGCQLLAYVARKVVTKAIVILVAVVLLERYSR
jgi:hypothetical protein